MELKEGIKKLEEKGFKGNIKETNKNVEIVDKMPILYKFTSEEIQKMIDIINELDTKGVANAQRIVFLVQMLADPERKK